jgi:hypothetical protein
MVHKRKRGHWMFYPSGPVGLVRGCSVSLSRSQPKERMRMNHLPSFLVSLRSWETLSGPLRRPSTACVASASHLAEGQRLLFPQGSQISQTSGGIWIAIASESVNPVDLHADGSISSRTLDDGDSVPLGWTNDSSRRRRRGYRKYKTRKGMLAQHFNCGGHSRNNVVRRVFSPPCQYYVPGEWCFHSSHPIGLGYQSGGSKPQIPSLPFRFVT